MRQVLDGQVRRGRRVAKLGRRTRKWLRLRLRLRLGLGVALLVCVCATASAQVETELRDGDRYFDDGDWKRAAAAYDRALKRFPAQVPASAWGKRAAIFTIVRDWQAGLRFVAEAKRVLGAVPEVGEQEALMLWALARKTEAVQVAEAVVVARPQAFSNQNIIGEYYAANDAGKTVAAYDAYLAHRPNALASGDLLPRLRLGFALLTVAQRDTSGSALETFAKAERQFVAVRTTFGKRALAAQNADNGLCAAYVGLGKYDQAVAACERVVQQGGRGDLSGAVWYNLGVAYLNKRQQRKARLAASEFMRIRHGDSRALTLLGDVHFAELDWQGALTHYLRAEQQMRAGQTREAIGLAVRLGKTYRRLPGADQPQSPQLALAVAKLRAALQANPDALDLVLELGAALASAQQDANVVALVRPWLHSDLAGLELSDEPALPTEHRRAGPDVRISDDARARLLGMLGKAWYNLGRLPQARMAFARAVQLQPHDVAARRRMIETLNALALATLARDPRGAQRLLDEALLLDSRHPLVLTNLAVLALDRGDCEAAVQHLEAVAKATASHAEVRLRLLARAYQCVRKPDIEKARAAYVAAEAEAKRVGARSVLAEVYIESAQLEGGANAGDAVEKLQAAIATAPPEVLGVAKRNLTLALFRRGWQRLRDGAIGEALTDFERAKKSGTMLRGVEPQVIDYAIALAQLERGAVGEGLASMRAVFARPGAATYVPAPFAAWGAAFFAAYGNYRGGNAVARENAARELQRFASTAPSGLTSSLQQMAAVAWELAAFDHWRSGRLAAAQRDLAAAQSRTDAAAERRIIVDRAAMGLAPTDIARLEALQGEPPEALINLGILYERAGRMKDAYEVWVRARARGANHKDLPKWIDAKKKIYGF